MRVKFETNIWRGNKAGRATLMWSGSSIFLFMAKIKLAILKFHYNSQLSKFETLYFDIKEI